MGGSYEDMMAALDSKKKLFQAGKRLHSISENDRTSKTMLKQHELQRLL